MRQMFIRCTALLIALTVTAATTASAQGVDTGAPDSLTIGSVSTFPAIGSVTIPVTFANDVALGAIEVTMRVGSAEVTIDSFSFVGGRVEGVSFQGASNRDNQTANVFVLPSLGNSIPPGSGLLGNLYCRFPSSIAPALIGIDTVTVTEIQITFSTSFTEDGEVASYKPVVTPGSIDIQQTPMTLDSVWVASVTGEPNGNVIVDVGLFNELAVDRVVLSLQYGNNDLIYDSVSFQSTRFLPPIFPSVQTRGFDRGILIVADYPAGDSLSAGSGIAARIHFTVADTATESFVPIDTFEYASGFFTSLRLSPEFGGGLIIPQVTPGGVQIRIPTDVDDELDGLPGSYRLAQNYPNPFNPETVIEFELAKSGQVRLEVFNVLGRRVRSLIDGPYPAGAHRVTFDGRSSSGQRLASGIYFYRLVADEAYRETRKMVLLK